MEGNKIIGRQIAEMEMKWDEKESKYVPVHGGLSMLVGDPVLDLYTVSLSSIDDCIDAVTKKSIEQIKKDFDVKSDDEYKNAGFVVTSESDPRLSCSVEIGSKRNNDFQYEILNGFPTVGGYPIGLTMKFFLDVDGIMKELEVPERSLGKDEQDIISRLYKDSTEQPEVLKNMHMAATTESVEIEKMVLGESEEGEESEEEEKPSYDVETVEKLCAHIQSAGFECSHSQEKDAPVKVEIKKEGKKAALLMIEDIFEETETDKNGEEVSVKKLKLTCSLDPEREFVVVISNSSVSDDGLVELLNGMEKGEDMNFYESYMKLDRYGIPLMESESAVKDSDIKVPDVSEKDKEVEKKDGISVGAKEGEPEMAVVGQDKLDDVSKEKKGEVESGEEKVKPAEIKVGEPGEAHGKPMSEQDWRVLSNRVRQMQESLRRLESRFERKIREISEASEKGSFARKPVMAKKMEAKKPELRKLPKVEAEEKKPEQKAESKALPEAMRKKLREMKRAKRA